MDRQAQQAILARDIIDMIYDFADNQDALEYLDSFAFSLARVFEDTRIVNWDAIASVCDQRYYSLKEADPVPLETTELEKCRQAIAPYLPKEQ